MPPVVRIALPGRRRPIFDSVPIPRVRLRDARPHDDLDSACGILVSVLAGGAVWIAILCAWLIWN